MLPCRRSKIDRVSIPADRTLTGSRVFGVWQRPFPKGEAASVQRAILEAQSYPSWISIARSPPAMTPPGASHRHVLAAIAAVAPRIGLTVVAAFVFGRATGNFDALHKSPFQSWP